MSNALEFILKLADQLSPAMRAAANVSDSTTARIQNDMNKVQGSSRMLGASVNELREKLNRLNDVRFSTRIVSQFDAATREARRLENQIDRLENKGRSGGGMLGGLLAGFGAYQAFKLTGGAAAEREQQQISFGVMTGSQAKGNKLLNDLVSMGATTPYESADLIKNSETLLGFGIAQEKILPTMRMLGDVARGNKEKLGALSLAYAQVQSAQKLQGQDLLQFINAGFNPLKIIADKTGLSMAKLKEQMEKGRISADMVAAAFQSATGPGGMFYQMMEKQSQTMAGRWSTLMDNAKMRLLAIGEALKPVINFVLDLTSAFINNGPVLATTAIGIGALVIAINGVSWATRIWAFAQGILNVVMMANPIVLIIGLIAILAVWIINLTKKYEGWGNSIRAVWEIIKSFVKMNFIIWKAFGETVWFYIQYGWLKFQSFVEWITGAIGNVGRAIGFLFTLEFGKAKDALFAEIITPSSKAIDELEKKHAANQSEYKRALGSELISIQEQYNKIGVKKIEGKGAPSTGINPITANLAGNKNVFSGLKAGVEGDAKSKADNINSGGNRPIVINIGKQIENLVLHTTNIKEGIDEIGAMVREEMRRVLYSANGTVNA
jgi:tape measure domain-containing protein